MLPFRVSGETPEPVMVSDVQEQNAERADEEEEAHRGYAECTRTLIVHARVAREIPLALGLKPEHINTSIERNRG